MAVAALEALVVRRALSNTGLDMKVIFIIPEEENREILADIPSIPKIDDCVTADNHTLYRLWLGKN